MIKKKSKVLFIRYYLESIVQIIEDDYLFSNMQLMICKAILFISQFQVGIYILQNSSDRALIDLKIQSVAQIAQLLSLNYILVLQDSYYVSLIVLCILQSLIYLYFIYVGIFSIFQNKFAQLFQHYQSLFRKINQLMSTYLFLFIYLLMNYQIELSLSILACNQNSLFSQDRIIADNSSQASCNLMTWQKGLGISGLIMSGINAFICLYFFRSHQFQDENLLKRKYSITFLFIIIIKSLITITQFSNITESSMLIFKHILLQLYGLISIYDSIFNQPFQNEELSKFYIKISSALYCIIICFNAWVHTSWLKDFELFYLILTLSIILEAFLVQIYNYRFEKRMHVDVYSKQNIQKTLRGFRFDLYISELVNLGQQSLQREDSKLRLQKIFQIHQYNCNLNKCYCDQIIQMKHDLTKQQFSGNLLKFQQLFLNEDNKTVNQQAILQVADSLFTYSLNQKGILDDQIEFEYLSLQYITFIVKCYKNFTKANYLLKQMIQQIKHRFSDQSIYFQLIANIITQRLESEIGKLNEQFIQQKNQEELNIRHVTLSDELSNFYIPIFKNIIHDKQEMWGKMQQGFANMNQFQVQVLKLMQKIQHTRIDFFRQTRKAERQIDLSYCLMTKKLKSLFYLFVLNDNLSSYHLEEEILDLRKRDAFSEKDVLSNENLIKKNIVSITISISENLGMIKSKKDQKTAQFFGFNSQEFQKINRINDLMPHFIEKNHDNMIRQFVSRGTSSYIKSFLYSFCVNNKGYVMPVKIYTDFSFLSLDDFYIQGVMLKVNKGSQYMVFERTGKIVGITEKLAQKLFIETDILKTLPPAEQAIKNLNALLLFPQIISKLQKKKKFILQNYEQQPQDVIQQSDKGYFYFDSTFMSQYQQFLSYFDKKKMTQTKSRNPESISTKYETNLNLDLLSREAMRKYHKFIKFQIKSKSLQSSSKYTIGQSQKTESSFLKNRLNQSTNNPTHSINTQFTKQIFKFQKLALKLYKMSFKYALSYHTLPIFSSQLDNQNRSQNNMQSNSREIYFSLQIDDMQLKENQKQNQSQYENTFQENLANYLTKLSCIPTLQQLNKYILQQSEDEDEEEMQLKEQSSTIDQKIPKSFLKFLNQNAQKTKRKEEEVQSQNSNRQKKSRFAQQDQSENISFSSYQSSSSQSESNSEEEGMSFGEDGNNQKPSDSKNLVMQKNISDKFSKIQTKLDQILEDNEISVTDMLSIDSYYKAKRVILQNSNAGGFISVLEAAIAQELFELRKENQIKSHYYSKEDSSQNSIKFLESQNHNEGQITFRNIQPNISMQKSSLNQRNQFQKLKSDISGLSQSKKEKSQRNSLQFIEDKEEEQNLQQQNVKNYDENIEEIHLNLQQDQNSFINISHRLDASHEILTTNNLNQSYRHLNPSSHLFVAKSNEIAQEQTTQDYLDASPLKYRNFQKQESSQLVAESTSDNIKLKKSISKKNKFVKNSSLFAHNSDLQNNLKIKFIQNSTLEQDLNYKNLSSLPTNNQKIEIKHLKHDISGSSKIGTHQKTNASKQAHEDLLNVLLNNGGLKEGLGEKVSVHSSSRSSSSQVVVFLKEIIQKAKVPSGAKSYSVLLVIFTLIFIGLNLTNLMIIQDDMQTFSESTLIIRSPRKLLRNYAKSLYGKYILLQIESNYLTDTSDKYFKQLGEKYLTSGMKDYITILETQSTTLIQYLQKYQSEQDSKTYNFHLYNNYVLFQSQFDTSLFFDSIIYDLLCNQQNYGQNVQNNCFTTLRANFFTYGTSVANFISFVIDTIIDTAQNLILKFTYISVAAIISVIVIPLCAIPFAKNINSYEEKILMIVSRVYYSQSQIERQKLHICQQLLQLDDSEWLKQNYSDVFNLKYHMFDQQMINTIHQTKTDQESKRVETTFQNKQFLKSRNQTYISPPKINNSKVKSTANQLDSKLKSQKENQQNPAKKPVQNTLLFNSIGQRQNQQISQGSFNSSIMQSRGKNYILQSRIQDQKLSVIKRIQSLLVLMTVAIVYFLIIIIYLNEKSSYLQLPVQINRKTNLIHVNSINYLISSEFLAFDNKLRKVLPSYQINDLESFYDIVNSSLDKIQQQSNELTDIMYGDNPYTPEVKQKMKNLMEGYICPYMTINNCTGSPDQLTDFGIKTTIAQFFQIHNSFLNVFDPTDTPDDQLKQYLNSQERVIAFTDFFKTKDEVFDVFSSTANQSITSVSNEIQDFIQNFLIYCGCVVALLIISLFTYTVRNLYKKIQLTNMFLIFIPEEKLFEDVTLQMLKNIKKM